MVGWWGDGAIRGDGHVCRALFVVVLSLCARSARAAWRGHVCLRIQLIRQLASYPHSAITVHDTLKIILLLTYATTYFLSIYYILSVSNLNSQQ